MRRTNPCATSALCAREILAAFRAFILLAAAASRDLHAASGGHDASPMSIADKLRSLSLPGNWQVRTDEEGNQFYWNSHTFKKQSTRPKALGLGWREQRDHETGEVYIYNILTRQSQAAPPERQVQRPPPEIVPPPPTVEMYEESVRQRRQTMLEESTKTSPADVSVRTSSMREPSQAFHTHRAAAKAGVPVAVDPFSLRNRAGCKTLCGPAWPSCAQPACGSSAPAEMTVLLPNQAHAGAAPRPERKTARS